MGNYLPARLPTSVHFLVRAHCADYKRRKQALASIELSFDVCERLSALNEAIETALFEVEVPLRQIILRDIAEGRGYDSSSAVMLVSKSCYYARKNRVVRSIACNLKLV